MPKQRKPTSQIAAETIARNRSRYAGRELNEPKPTKPLSAPPKHFGAGQKKLWKELVGSMPAGVLFAVDATVLELTVLLIEKMRFGVIKSAEIGHLRGCLAALGATPADRSRVSVAPPESTEDDPTAFLDD